MDFYIRTCHIPKIPDVGQCRQNKTPFLNYILNTVTVNMLVELNHPAAVDMIHAHIYICPKILPYVRNRKILNGFFGGFTLISFNFPKIDLHSHNFCYAVWWMWLFFFTLELFIVKIAIRTQTAWVFSKARVKINQINNLPTKLLTKSP